MEKRVIKHYESDCLKHHGVFGQRKGVLHGPPYPIRAAGKVVKVVKSKLAKSNPLRKDANQQSKQSFTNTNQQTKQYFNNAKQSSNSSNQQSKQTSNSTNQQSKQSSNNSREKQIIRTMNNKQIKKMSTQDLQDAVNRIQLEQRYKQLQEDVYTSKSSKYLKSELGKAATSVITYAVRKIGQKAVDNALNKDNKDNKNDKTNDFINNATKTTSTFSKAFNQKSSTVSIFKDTVKSSIDPTMNDLRSAWDQAVRQNSSNVIYQSGPTVPRLTDGKKKY